ncbi:hypothetical protein PHMEG_00018853 [Phytophthora megakarya]|uniref:Uncharacterized protein n=1 Tax=Phytophthora megakarya TaxID=4795 RepID=A0A225VUT5_9STRA|nr:hypothetical protein PHMEG_00018853 [Phytophthora megakarya]
MIPEFLFEPTMSLYGMQYLTWYSKTPMWLKEVTELDAREPWRNYWLDCPEKHPYNTTFYPCNPDRPLFVPDNENPAPASRENDDEGVEKEESEQEEIEEPPRIIEDEDEDSSTQII